MNFKALALTCLISLGLWSCRKEISPDAVNSDAASVAQYQVPESFEWKSEKNYRLEIQANQFIDRPQTGDIIVIKQGQKTVDMLAWENENSLSLEYLMPADLSASYSVKNLRSKEILFFNSEGQLTNGPARKIKQQTNTYKSAGNICNASEYDRVINDDVENLTVDGEKVLLTKKLEGSLTLLNGAELTICEDAKLTAFNSDAKNGVKNWLNIGPDGEIEFENNLNLSEVHQQIRNYGKLECKKKVIIGKGRLENYGEFKVEKSLSIAVNGYLFNQGFLEIKQDLDCSGEFINEDEVKIERHLDIESSGRAENNCHIEIEEKLNLYGTLVNSAFMEMEKAYLNSGSSLDLYNRAHIYVKHSLDWLGGSMTNSGSLPSLIEVKKYSKIKSQDVSKSGAQIDWYDDYNGVEQDDAGIYDEFSHGKIDISKDACNNRGFKSDQDEDDGDDNENDDDDDDDDGVDDEDDADDDDNRVSLASKSPASGKQWLLFEDLWPSEGDYDFNDLVLSYTAHLYKNTDNKSVYLDLEVEVHAMGGSSSFDLCLQMLKKSGGDSYNQVAGIFSSTQSDERITVYDEGNHIRFLESHLTSITPYYTNNGLGPDGEVKNYKLRIELNDLKIKSNWELDLFLREHQGSKEIHTVNRPPATEAAKELMGTEDDASQESRNTWYKTDKNFPWGLSVITESNFKLKWAKGKNNFHDVYPEFHLWVESGGEQNQDWYRNPNLQLSY